MTRYVKVDDETAMSVLGEGIHTGLRKGSEAPSSGPLWRAITDSKDGAWPDALRYCVWGLDQMGLALCRKVPE